MSPAFGKKPKDGACRRNAIIAGKKRHTARILSWGPDQCQ